MSSACLSAGEACKLTVWNAVDARKFFSRYQGPGRQGNLRLALCLPCLHTACEQHFSHCHMPSSQPRMARHADTEMPAVLQFCNAHQANAQPCSFMLAHRIACKVSVSSAVRIIRGRQCRVALPASPACSWILVAAKQSQSSNP
jgi:hypothetical protein